MVKNVSETYADYLKNLPISREVEVESLRSDEIETITETVFVEPQLSPADILFIFGTSTFDDSILERIAHYAQQGFFTKVLVAGLVGRLYYETGKPLAHIMRDELVERGVSADMFMVQDRSTNTLEDVQFSLDLLKSHGPPEHIAFVSKAHHSGRCLRTLKRFFAQQRLSAITYNADYEGVEVAKRNWYRQQVSRGRVYGEFLRIKKYSARGDIAQL